MFDICAGHFKNLIGCHLDVRLLYAMKLSLVIWLLKLLTRPVASDMTDLTWTRFLIQTLISAQYKMAKAVLTSIIIHNIVMRILQVVGGVGERKMVLNAMM